MIIEINPDFGTIVAANEIFVADPSQANLDKLKQQVPTINTLANNAEAVKDADIVILAVKPWYVKLQAW